MSRWSGNEGRTCGYGDHRSASRERLSRIGRGGDIRSSVAGLVLTAGFWLLPMPGISLAERIFVCLALIVIVLADVAMELEPPRRKRR